MKLEWIYEESSSEVSVSSLVSPNTASYDSTRQIVPPPEENATLLDLAMRGDLRGLIEQTARLEATDRLATHLRQLAKGVKGKQIREFLKNLRGRNEFSDN